jgi:hypothetical protein
MTGTYVGGTRAYFGPRAALPALRRHVGAIGIVIAVDLTVEMLAEATRRGRRTLARVTRALRPCG